MGWLFSQRAEPVALRPVVIERFTLTEGQEAVSFKITHELLQLWVPIELAFQTPMWSLLTSSPIERVVRGSPIKSLLLPQIFPRVTNIQPSLP